MPPFYGLKKEGYKMAVQTNVKIKVNGKDKTFILNKWGMRKSMQHLPRIGKSFAVPISMLFSTSEEGFADKLPNALFMLFETMDEDDVWSLFELITEGVYKNSVEALNIEVDLEDDIGALIQLVTACIKANYGSLMSGKVLGNLTQVMVPMKTLSDM